jgi:hypothetical protein
VHPHLVSHSRTMFAAECDTQDMQGLGELDSTLGAQWCEFGQPFSKGALWATRRDTEEAADTYEHAHRLLRDREIAE